MDPFRFNENEYTVQQELCTMASAAVRGKFIALNVFIIPERMKTNELGIQIKTLDKQNKQEINMIKAGTN